MEIPFKTQLNSPEGRDTRARNARSKPAMDRLNMIVVVVVVNDY
jgi:hypothetical protein